jgi:hypothetical protein
MVWFGLVGLGFKAGFEFQQADGCRITGLGGRHSA